MYEINETIPINPHTIILKNPKKGKKKITDTKILRHVINIKNIIDWREWNLTNWLFLSIIRKNNPLKIPKI